MALFYQLPTGRMFLSSSEHLEFIFLVNGQGLSLSLLPVLQYIIHLFLT